MGTKETKKRILKALQGEGMDFKDILRENAINLANQHKKYCDDKDCDVSLFLLRELLRGCKIELTEAEEEVFL